MSSYGEDLRTKNLCTNNLQTTGTIFWNEDAPGGGFDPPLDKAGISTITAVLNAGNDANGLEIQNVGGISISTDGISRNPDPGHISGATEVDCNTLRATESFVVNANCITLDFDENAAGTTIQGSTLAGDPTVCTWLDLSSDTNTFGDQTKGTLAQTLVLGNSAGASSLNMNNQVISNAKSVGTLDCLVEDRILFSAKENSKLTGSSLAGHPTVVSNCDFASGSGNTFPADQLGDLAATMALGNQVSDDLNMEDAANTKRDIKNAESIGCVTLTAITSVNAPIIVGSTSVSTETFAGIDLNLNALSVAHANLKFTGTAGKGSVSSLAVSTNTGVSSQFPSAGTTFEAAGNSTYSGVYGSGLFLTLTTFPSGINDIVSATVSTAGDRYKTDETLTITEAQMRVIMSVPTLTMTTDVVLTITASLGHTFIKGDSTLTNSEPNLTECTYLDLRSLTNKASTAVNNPWNALMFYHPLAAGDKRWNDYVAAVINTDMYLPYTPISLPDTPSVMVPVHWSCSFYVAEINSGNVLAGLFGQNETSPGSGVWTPSINYSNGAITGNIQYGNQYIQQSGSGLENSGNTTIYGFINNLTVGVNYRFFPCIRTATNTPSGDVTIKWGNREGTEPWPPVVVNFRTVPAVSRTA